MLDHKPTNTGRWIKPGMSIQLIENRSSRKDYELDIPVIWEDEYLAIVDKPAGLPTSGNQFKNLENTLRFNLSPSYERGYFPKPVHRLDRATRGLVIIAKTPKARVLLGQMLENKTIKKHYMAIVSGNAMDEQGAIEMPIEGKSAKSTFKVLKDSTDGRYTLLELSPATGRTHQLRIHCAQKGWPILGDNQYGDGKGPGKGLFLCAYALSFLHPITNQYVDVKIDLPGKFDRYMDKRF